MVVCRGQLSPELAVKVFVLIFEDGRGAVRRGAPQSDSVSCTQLSAVGAHEAKQLVVGLPFGDYYGISPLWNAKESCR